MRPEPGGSDLRAQIAASSVDERVAWLAEMREAGKRSAWQQVDRAGITAPLEVAEFLLRRLYPAQSDVWFERVVAQLRAAEAAGAWTGFDRPGPRSTERPPE